MNHDYTSYDMLGLFWLVWFDGYETMLGVLRKAAGIFFYRSKSVEELTLSPPNRLEHGPDQCL